MVYISSTHILSACFIWPFVFVCFCFCSIKSLIFYSGIWADFCPMGHVGVDRLVTYHAYVIDCAGVSLLVHDLMLLDIFPWARWEIVIAAWSDYWFSFFDPYSVVHVCPDSFSSFLTFIIKNISSHTTSLVKTVFRVSFIIAFNLVIVCELFLELLLTIWEGLNFQLFIITLVFLSFDQFLKHFNTLCSLVHIYFRLYLAIFISHFVFKLSPSSSSDLGIVTHLTGENTPNNLLS